jgi:hypothetical protein
MVPSIVIRSIQICSVKMIHSKKFTKSKILKKISRFCLEYKFHDFRYF